MRKKNSYNIIFDLRDVLFDYFYENRGTAEQFKPIPRAIALVHQLHNQVDMHGRRIHKLYVLSNASSESYLNFITHYPDIFALFDGIVTSAQVGMQKPDIRFYQYLLNRYNLDPAYSIFIDDKKVNVDAARTTGIHGIVCTDIETVENQLKVINAL